MWLGVSTGHIDDENINAVLKCKVDYKSPEFIYIMKDVVKDQQCELQSSVEGSEGIILLLAGP